MSGLDGLRNFGALQLSPLVAIVFVGSVVLSPKVPPVQLPDQEVVPPAAKRIPVRLEAHGHMRIDDYFWLNERENPEVIAYLDAENAYTDAMMSHTETLQEVLFREMTGRVEETDIALPWRQGDYLYYYRWEEGREHPIYARKRGSLDADEELLIDVNEIAEGHSYTTVPYPAISPDQRIMAFAADTVGDFYRTMRFKDLTTGQFLDDVIDSTTSLIAWANDNRTLFYSTLTPTPFLHPHRVYRHVLGTDPSDDDLMYEEAAGRWRCCPLTSSSGYILAESWGPRGNEWRFLDADQPDEEFSVFLPRIPGHEYSIVPFGGYFYIRTNHGGAENFKLMRTAATETGVEHWEEVIAHREDVLLESFRVFKDHLVVVERKEGLVRLRIRPWSGDGEHYIDFGESLYQAGVMRSDQESNILRYQYSSLTTPNSVYDYNMDTREASLVTRDVVRGGFDPTNYVSERLYAPAQDGASIPVSIVYRKGAARDGENNLLLYAYGGGTVEAAFSPSLVSLLDRGFIYAIAHVRGGEELGRGWAEEGRGLNARNRFLDFIAAAEFLIQERYTNPSRLFAHGVSSGGLIMGAVANMRPDLFEGIVAQVPAVDILSQWMSDTAASEAGDPKQEAHYRYVLSYSPYQNVEAGEYPHMLVTTGLHDTQSPYWVPAKWVAKLRALKTDDNLLLLRTNMEGGHGGTPGRYEQWRHLAFLYAFILDLAGIIE